MVGEKDGYLPLHVAAQHQGGDKGTAVVKTLLKYKPEAAMVAKKDGYLPLHVAAQFQGGDKGTAVVELLLQAAPQAVHQKTKDNLTPMDILQKRVKKEWEPYLPATDPIIRMVEAAMRTKTAPLSTSQFQSPPATPSATYDVFISLRFEEAKDEAAALQVALQKNGLSVFLCAVDPGDDIAKVIVSALANCKMVVILGTKTYGLETDCKFSTYQELRYIIDQTKPFFLVKMCDQFEQQPTKFWLPNTVSYFPWQPKGAERKQIPSTLLQQILKRHADVVGRGSRTSTLSSVASPIKQDYQHQQTPKPSPAEETEELAADLVAWLSKLELGSADTKKAQEAMGALGITTISLLRGAIRRKSITVDELKSYGVRKAPAETLIEAAAEL